MLKLLNFCYFTANLLRIKSDCKGTLHQKQVPQADFQEEGLWVWVPLGLFSFLLLHTAEPKHPGVNCTQCHLLSRTWCHLALVRKPEQPPSPPCYLGLWQQPETRWDGFWHKNKSSQPQRGRSKPGCELQHAQLQSSAPPPMQGSLPARRTSTAPEPKPSGCTGREPQPSQAAEDAAQLVRGTTPNCRTLHLGSREKRNQETLWGISYRLLDK